LPHYRPVYDPGCVKTFQATKPGEGFSQIAQNLPPSEIVIALIAVRRDSCSIIFPRRRVFTQPRPKSDIRYVFWTNRPDIETGADFKLFVLRWQHLSSEIVDASLIGARGAEALGRGQRVPR
jgi:hypothetical protein